MLGHHRHTSATPLMAFRWRADNKYSGYGMGHAWSTRAWDTSSFLGFFKSMPFIIQFFYSYFGKRKWYIINMVKVMCKRSHFIDRENLSKNYKLACQSKYQDRSLHQSYAKSTRDYCACSYPFQTDGTLTLSEIWHNM